MSFKAVIYNAVTTPLRVAANLIDPPAVVLIYHRVTNLEIDTHQLAVSPDNFNDQIKYLKKSHNLITVDEFVHLLKTKKKFPKRTMLITFDDGYADNYLEALPILETHNAQAIFYITTSNLNTNQELWWDELERIMFTASHIPDELGFDNDGKFLSYPTATKEEAIQSHNKMHPIVKWQLPLQRENTLASLRKQVQLNANGRTTHRLMTFDELKQMSKSHSTVIGAHTHSHSPLSIFNKEEQLMEMKKSKDILEQLLSIKINHASYPFGTKKDFNIDSINVCNELGFEMTCANYYDQIHTWSNIQALPRALVRNWNLEEFKKKVAGFYRY